MIRNPFAKQEAALRRIQRRLRTASLKVQALSERLQAQGRSGKR